MDWVLNDPRQYSTNSILLEGEYRGDTITDALILFASPDTITGVTTLAIAHAKLALPVTALIAVVVATVVMGIVMVFVGGRGSHRRSGFPRDIATAIYGTNRHRYGSSVCAD
jgi:hypothetical protein